MNKCYEVEKIILSGHMDGAHDCTNDQQMVCGYLRSTTEEGDLESFCM